MATRTTNLGRKPRPPSRRELLESFKSLEAAKKQRRRSETSATAAEPSSLAYQERVSSGSEFKGTSWTSMERAPEGAGINGLSAIEDNDPFDPAAATPPPPPALRIGEAGLHKREQLSTLEDNSDIEIPELGSFSSPSPGIPDLDLDINVAGSFPSTLGTMDHVVLNLDPVVPMKLLSDHEPTFVNVLETKSLEEQQGSMMMQQEEPPLLVLQFSDLTYTVHKKISRWRRCFRKPTAVVASSAAVSRSSATAAAMATAPPPPPPPHSRLLLDHVSGEARDGEILAVMGPSGSGKSTLIDALAQRIESLEGRITLNSTHVSNSLLRSISAYVMQDDLLFPMLTVKETLMFSALFRMPRTQSTAKKRARVMHLLDQLGLVQVADTIIGDEARRGVSGGERRRVSIGIDIIHDPLLLFLDEPTSGLDSTSAYMVVRTLQKIAKTGSIVILSIHQPSFRILGLVDHLILLAFGQKVYGGPPAELHTYFHSFGRPVPQHENSTEHALDLIQELHNSQGGVKQLVEFCNFWIATASKRGSARILVGSTDVRGAISASISRGKLVASRPSSAFMFATQLSSPRHHHPQKTNNSHSQESDHDTKLSGADMVCKFANPWWTEIRVLALRSVMNIKRMPELFLMRLATVLFTAFLLATIFWNLDHSPLGIQERLGFFAFAMSTTFYTCADALPVFLQERYIFMRETGHNTYRMSSYVLANAMIYVPFLAVLAMSFVLTVWWAVGLAGGGSGFLFFFLIVWASFWAGNSFITLLSGVMPNVMLGYTVVVALLAYFLLLSGFFIARERIPKYWLWFHYLSLIKYPYEAVLINEFQVQGPCYESGSQILFGTPLASLSPTLVSEMLSLVSSTSALLNTPYANMSASSCILTGPDVLIAKQITELTKWQCLVITLAFGVLFRFLFYAILRFSGRNKRE